MPLGADKACLSPLSAFSLDLLLQILLLATSSEHVLPAFGSSEDLLRRLGRLGGFRLRQRFGFGSDAALLHRLTHQRHHPLKPRWNCHSRCTGKDQHPSCNSAVKSLRSQQASIAPHSTSLGA